MNLSFKNMARLAQPLGCRFESLHCRQSGVSIPSLAFVFALSCFVWCGTAQASLLGTSVTSQYYAFNGLYDFAGSPKSFAANGTVQQTFCTGCPEGFNLTVSDTQIDYQFFGDGGFWDTFGPALDSGGLYIDNGNLLTFAGVAISSVKLDAASNVPGITSSNVTFNSSNVAVDWAAISGIVPGEKIILDVISSSVATPEPAEWSILLTGLMVAGVWRRCRRFQEARC